MADHKKLFILDASVLLKLVLNKNEKHRENARQIADDFIKKKIKVGTPSHCFSEIMNTLGVKNPKIAITFFSELLQTHITEYRLTLEIAGRAIKIMQKFPKISFYDAAYHATAIENKGTFITADENYYKKTKSLNHIKLLKDY